MIKVSKKTREEFIKLMLSTNDSWMMNSFEYLIGCQTGSEIKNQETTESNKSGFRTVDAGMLTRFHKIWSDKKKSAITTTNNLNNIFSASERAILRKVIPRYWRQILVISNIHDLDILILKHEIKIRKDGKAITSG